MSETLHIREFAQKGLNTDIPAWDLDPGFVTSLNNVRIINNQLITFGGYKSWSVPPEQFDPGLLIHGGALSSPYWVVFGADAVYAFDGEIWTDISSAAGYGPLNDSTFWIGDILSSFVIATHPQIYPEFWAGTLVDPMQPLPFDATRTWLDVDIRCGLMRSHKDFLIAMDLNEAGTELIDTVRWSDAADVGFLPGSWDEADPSVLAGKAQLGGSLGKIIDGMSLRDSFVIYRENGISVMDYTGDAFVWKIRHLEQTTGLINKNCIVEVKGRHFFIGDGDILMNDGNTVDSIMHKRIRKRFLTAKPEFIRNWYAFVNDLFKEIWFCVIEKEGSVYPDTAYIFNWKDNTWFTRDLNPETTFIAQGPTSLIPERTWDNWEETWDTATSTWDKEGRTPLGKALVGIKTDPQQELIIIDDTDNDNVEEYICLLERTDLPIAGHERVVTVQEIFPFMSGTIPVTVRLGSQQRPGGPISWKPEIQFDSQTDRKINLRVTGELIAFRVQSSFNDGSWSLSGMDVKYVVVGER